MNRRPTNFASMAVLTVIRNQIHSSFDGGPEADSFKLLKTAGIEPRSNSLEYVFRSAVARNTVPKTLYHYTSAGNIRQVCAEGLMPQSYLSGFREPTLDEMPSLWSGHSQGARERAYELFMLHANEVWFSAIMWRWANPKRREFSAALRRTETDIIGIEISSEGLDVSQYNEDEPEIYSLYRKVVSPSCFKAIWLVDGYCPSASYLEIGEALEVFERLSK